MKLYVYYIVYRGHENEEPVKTYGFVNYQKVLDNCEDVVSYKCLQA